MSLTSVAKRSSTHLTWTPIVSGPDSNWARPPTCHSGVSVTILPAVGAQTSEIGRSSRRSCRTRSRRPATLPSCTFSSSSAWMYEPARSSLISRDRLAGDAGIDAPAVDRTDVAVDRNALVRIERGHDPVLVVDHPGRRPAPGPCSSSSEGRGRTRRSSRDRPRRSARDRDCPYAAPRSRGHSWRRR